MLIADDHVVVREGLVTLLTEHDFDVVGAVGDGHLLIDAAIRLRPDVIVTDMSMPRIDGITAAIAILRENPTARIVFVTVHGDTSLVERGLSTGALGYVLKLAAGEELVAAVHAALRSERYVSQALRWPTSTTGMP